MFNPLDATDPHPFHDDDMLGDTPIGQLSLRREPHGYVSISVLDWCVPDSQRRSLIHVLDQRGVLAGVYGRRPLEHDAVSRMYAERAARDDAFEAARRALLRVDEAKEWRRMIAKDQDVAVLLKGERVQIVR
jgi:hypothetical protein